MAAGVSWWHAASARLHARTECPSRVRLRKRGDENENSERRQREKGLYHKTQSETNIQNTFQNEE